MIDISVDLDLFTEQRVEITRRIKDFSDVTAKEGEFSRSFQGPASRKNQLALENYGILGTQSEFNPHKGIPCQWSFSSFVRFTGRLEVTSVVYKDGKPYSFSFNFYGRQRSLANIFGADRFSDIDWSEFDHTLTYFNVISSWQGNLDGNDDLLYPIIDGRANYFFGPESLNIPGNIRNPNRPILLTDLKPAIRLQRFLKVLFSSYGLSLVGDLVDTESEFHSAYILPNRWSGGGVEADTFDDNLAAYNAAGGDNSFLNTPNTEAVITFGQQIQDENNLFDGTTFTANVTGEHTLSVQAFMVRLGGLTAGPGRYALRVKKNGVTEVENFITLGVGNTSAQIFIIALNIFLEAGDMVEVFFARITYSVGPFNFPGTAGRVVSGSFTMQAPANQLDQTVSFNDQMPDDKIVEWLSNFAKSKNMLFVPDAQDDTKWELVSIRSYYEQGSSRDWTGFIDLANITFTKPKVYREISIGYTPTDAAVQTAFADATGRNFGAVDIRPDVEFGDDKLEIMNPCTLIPPSLFRVVDAAGEPTGQFADVTIHKSLNIEGNPVKEPWLLFYYNFERWTTLPYYIQTGLDGPNPTVTLQGTYPHISAFQDITGAEDSNTLCFSLESDLNGRVPANTAYQRYWERELQLQYAKESRVLVRSKIVLPTLQFYNYNLNDEIYLENQYWRIDEITHDQDGKNAFVTLSSSRTLLPVNTRTVRPGGRIDFDRAPSKLDVSAAGAYAKSGGFYGSFARAQITPNLEKYGEIVNNITQIVINEIEEIGGRFRTWDDEGEEPES